MELTRKEIAWLAAVCPRSLEVWAGKNGIACVGICPIPFATVTTINPDKDVDFAKLFATAPALAALALALMDERDRLRMQVRAAEEVIEKADTVITVETAEGLAALCAIQAWQITPTEMYYRNEAEMEAAHAEAGQ